jgi:membrane-bound metal-dependent hydrolase YbcI (DUF457 family)
VAPLVPLTPFHLGPALLVGALARRRLDLPTLLAASVVVDARAALVVFGPLDPPVHGVLTTFAGAAVVAVLLSLAVLAVAPFVVRILDGHGLDWNPSLTTVPVSALVGTLTHVVLDAFLYGDVRPFAPLSGNPFLGLAPSTAVYVGCLASLVLGVGLFAWHAVVDRSAAASAERPPS